MGIAAAAAAARRGHRVTLVLGPTREPPPPGVRVVRVTSALEMAAAVRRAHRTCDALIMTAAVADWRPARRLRGKPPKSARRVRLDLVPTPDILGGLARRKGRRIHVGFALQTGGGLRAARAKLRAKNLDAIVLDHPAAMGRDRATVTWIGHDGRTQTWRDIPKRRFGTILCRSLERLRRENPV
jgi:phosphopantothenoylcysteine decarboxylase/phosphopantothenate--cysteine ligase